MQSNLDKRLAKLEQQQRPEIVYCADFYYSVLMTPEEAEHAPDWVKRWRAMHTIDPVELAEIHRRACERAAEIEAAALQGWDPNAPPPEE